jgi:hypothetical protein
MVTPRGSRSGGMVLGRTLDVDEESMAEWIDVGVWMAESRRHRPDEGGLKSWPKSEGHAGVRAVRVMTVQG